MTTAGEFLHNATQTLETAGIESARLDCLILLEDTLKRDRASIIASPEIEIEPADIRKLNKQIVQRTGHVPLAYIRGRSAFYGRNFIISQGVLVPRPETEAMITLLDAINFDLPAGSEPLHIADIGTGSGCLGITAALEVPGSTIDLYDIDAAALDCAGRNASKHHVHAGLYREDLLSGAHNRHYDVLLANLPYVPTGYPINEAAKHEPEIALFSGTDGLTAYRQLWKQIQELKRQPTYVLTEALELQHASLVALAKAAGFTHIATDGLVQQFKAVTA